VPFDDDDHDEDDDEQRYGKLRNPTPPPTLPVLFGIPRNLNAPVANLLLLVLVHPRRGRRDNHLTDRHDSWCCKGHAHVFIVLSHILPRRTP
jgi:hypothetical protein